MIPGDPFIVLMNMGKGGIGAAARSLPYAFAFLAAILVSAFFLGRTFCKYLCPAGAWYALLSKLSPNRVLRNEGSCIGCGLCSKACPMNIDVAHSKKVKSAECIGCRECVNACPQKGALSAPIGSLDLPSALVPLAAAAVFAGGLCLASASMPAQGEGPRGAGRRSWAQGRARPRAASRRSLPLGAQEGRLRRLSKLYGLRPMRLGI